MSWRDRIIGVVLGVILGIGVVVFFVFVYSDRTVDAPSLAGRSKGGAATTGGGSRHHGPPPVATVRVVSGAPKASGPAELHYRKGDLVRLRVTSNLQETLSLLGYGITRTVPANGVSTIRFRATKGGNFPLIVTASHIAIARLTVDGPAR
jgi:hypothetical protein